MLAVSLIVALLALISAGPPGTAPTRGAAPMSAPVAPPTSAPTASSYSEAAARADLDVLVQGRGREYLDARARLEANAAIVAPLVAARLASSPPPGPAEEQRLLALLGAFGRPEDLRVFGAQLRRDVLAAAPGAALQAADRWRALFRQQGAAAIEVLRELVADRDLPEEIRGALLGDLVAAIPREQIGEFGGMVGVGTPALRVALRQALVRRAKNSADERAAILAGLDAAATSAAPAQLAALLGARALVAAQGGGGDEAFTERLIELAEAAERPFVVRVAAIRILGERVDREVVRAALVRIAIAHLPGEVRGAQASELLAWLALEALPTDAAAELVGRFALHEAEAPRLAALAYARGELPADAGWLERALEHPWPEVRVAALGRVMAPCAGDRVRRLEREGSRADADALAAREAIRALGRCGSSAYAALDRLLVDADLESSRRADAGRQLVASHGIRGAERVADVMARTIDLGLRRRLLEVLREVEGPTPAIHASLCDAAIERELRAEVTQALRALFPDTPCPASE